ncbi:hypothetical protein [Hoeflea alexandrii]|jgi:hypothetical protein
MKPPRYSLNHPNYGAELEAEIEPFLTEIIDRVVDAGWSKDATWTALISLVADLERSTLETSETDNLVKEVVSLLDNFR